MKNAPLLVALGLALTTMTAHAANTQDFTVGITLSSACQFSGVTGPTFSYTAFGSASSLVNGGFTAACTSGLSYTVALTAGTGDSGGTYNYTDNGTGLAYSIGLKNAAATAFITASQTGSSSGTTYTLVPVASSGQAGSCTGPTCLSTNGNNSTKTITVTY